MAQNTTTQEDLKSLYTAFNLYANWDRMSPAQKSKAVIALGLQSYKFTTGEDFAKQWLIKPDATGEGLTFGQAFSLFGTGVNVYSLARNWKQMNTVQRVTGGVVTAANIANTAKSLNLLGYGTQGAAVQGATAAQLSQAGWSAAPSYGVGAVTANTGSQIPAGYTAVASEGGKIVAVPAANAATAGGGMPWASMGSQSYAGYLGAGLEIYNTFANNKNVRDNDQLTYHQKHAGLAVADIWTGGGASAAYGLLMSTSVGRRLDSLYNKIDAKINPVTIIGTKLLNSDKWKTEGDRLKALQEKGVYIPENLITDLPTKGRTKEELVARAEASGGNVAFAKGRKESDLTAKDIVGYAVWAEKDPEWFKKPMDERLKIADEALKEGRIQEHHGTIDIQDDTTPAEQSLTPAAGTMPQPQGNIDPNRPTQAVRFKNLNGAAGGSQMQAGLANILKVDPYVGGALIAHSAFSDAFKDGDGGKGLGFLKSQGLLDHDNFLLTDGRKVDVLNQSDKIDTNNDLAYYAGLTGITMSELLANGKDPSVAKAGQKLGNAMLSSVSNTDFTPENFAVLRDNFRAAFSKAGIGSKADAYALANVMYAGDRIDDLDLVRMHQAIDMTFQDDGHQIAARLLPGRMRGLQVAEQDAKVQRVGLSAPPSNPVQPTGNIDPGRIPNNSVSQQPSSNFMDNALYVRPDKRPLRNKEDVVMQNRQRYGSFNAEIG